MAVTPLTTSRLNSIYMRPPALIICPGEVHDTLYNDKLFVRYKPPKEVQELVLKSHTILLRPLFQRCRMQAMFLFHLLPWWKTAPVAPPAEHNLCPEP